MGGPPQRQAERERLASYVLEKPPADVGRRLDIDFDGKVVLLGAKLTPPGMVRPGQKVRLTLYWQAKQRVGAGWNLFTHLLDGSGERIANYDDDGPLRKVEDGLQIYGPWAWEPGKVYVDEQELTLPDRILTDELTLVTGLWKGDQRMPIESGPHDRHHRGIAARLEVAGARRSTARVVQNTRVPFLRVNKLPPGASIEIDGKLDEPAWRRASSTGSFRNVGTGQPNRRRDLAGRARLTWNDQAMYVGISVTDTDIVGGFDPQQEDPHLWKRDTTEIMIDPDGDGDNRDYYEIQISPQNLVFDSRFDTYNQPRREPDGPFGHQEWSAKLDSAVTVEGSLGDDADRDQGYVVEARIPWTSFTVAEHAPPRVGDEWRMNFYAIEENGGVSWSPILRQGNFHKTSRFGRVLWAEKGWAPPGSKRSPPASSSSHEASPKLKLAPRPRPSVR